MIVSHSTLQQDKYELKAAYIERFTRFIEWTSESEILKDYFVIGVLGDKNLSNALGKIFANQKIKNKKVVVKYFSNENDIKDVHVLYVHSSFDNRLDRLIRNLRSEPILTISQSAGFCQRGIHINLFFSNGYLRFEINEKALRESGLKASHLLLRQAKIINE